MRIEINITQEVQPSRRRNRQCRQSGTQLPRFSPGTRPYLEKHLAQAKGLALSASDPALRATHQKLASYLEKALEIPDYGE